MHSKRFGMPVVLTEHAKQRMHKRGVNEGLVLDIIETGIQKDAGHGHFWIYKNVEYRNDNLLCVAVVIENVMVVKTIMHHWESTP